MQKYGQNEPAEVFRGEEAAVVNEHLSRVGKAVSEFDANELQALQSDLDVVRKQQVQQERETAQVKANGGPTATPPDLQKADDLEPQETKEASEGDATTSNEEKPVKKTKKVVSE